MWGVRQVGTKGFFVLYFMIQASLVMKFLPNYHAVEMMCCLLRFGVSPLKLRGFVRVRSSWFGLLRGLRGAVRARQLARVVLVGGSGWQDVGGPLLWTFGLLDVGQNLIKYDVKRVSCVCSFVCLPPCDRVRFAVYLIFVEGFARLCVVVCEDVVGALRCLLVSPPGGGTR